MWLGIFFHFWITLLSFGVSFYLFRNEIRIATVFFIVVSIRHWFGEKLLQNKTAIVDEKKNPYKENTRTVAKFLMFSLLQFFFFLIIFVLLRYKNPGSYDIFVSNFQTNYSLDIDVRNYLHINFRSILFHNMMVLEGAFLVAIFYRHLGLAFILVYMVFHWALISTELVYMMDWHWVNRSVMFLSLMPHLVFEISAYVVACISGNFVSRALLKYYKDPVKLLPPLVASFQMLGFGIFLIVTGAIIESCLPKFVLEILLHRYR